MTQTEPISIYYSKKAYGFGLFIMVIIFFVGIAMMTVVIGSGAWNFSPHPFSKYGITGIFLMLGSALLGNFYRKKLGETAPAIVVYEKGIAINNKKQQFVSWGAIDHIEVTEVSTSNSGANKTKYLVPVLKDPEAYFNDTTKKILGALDKLNIEANAGQPVSISTTFLKCSFDELKDILETGLDAYNAREAS